MSRVILTIKARRPWTALRPTSALRKSKYCTEAKESRKKNIYHCAQHYTLSFAQALAQTLNPVYSPYPSLDKEPITTHTHHRWAPKSFSLAETHKNRHVRNLWGRQEKTGRCACGFCGVHEAFGGGPSDKNSENKELRQLAIKLHKHNFLKTRFCAKTGPWGGI